MGAPRRFSIATHFIMVSFGSAEKFSYREMVLFGGSFWVSVSVLLLVLFGFINRMFFRFREQGNDSKTVNSSSETVISQEKSPISSSLPEQNYEPEVPISDVTDEEETPNFFSKFQFRRYEEFAGSNSDSVSCSGTDTGTAVSSSTSKYEFISGKAFGVFMEEPEAMSFTVKELFADKKQKSEEEAFHEETPQEQQSVDVEKLPNLASDQYVSENDSLVSDFDSNSIVSNSDGFLSDGDFEKTESEDIISNIEDSHEDISTDALESDMPEIDFHDELSGKDNSASHNLDNNSGKCKAQDSEDCTGFESLWEHQDLIEQLKMELKKVRATGLPTIMEESESPKMMEDLKPWKIEEKLQHHDTMSELHKFYKSYRERMRKFDIFNYQKMYAIGFLQAKDPLQSISVTKSPIPVIGSLLSESFRVCKRKKSKSDPMIRFTRELHSDLEMVYVGQLCLSWEFLHWQYEKTLELWESDPHGIRRYNEIAGEFQQFQVLMQRFVENERFEGPRVQNYVKNRCILRNLLQVPVIREDNLKDTRKARGGKREDAITSDTVVEIMEESIRIFWRFVRADKDTNSGMQIVRRESQVEVQGPADKKLLLELRTNLQKKERKLKDILRSGNCILKRFQRHQEDSSEQVLYFFSQVDMKLVARVLNMSRITTDQLLWCHNKLSKISFVNRKINVEPSFLLFPC